MDEADCVVIVPCWKTQVWFPKLVAVMTDFINQVQTSLTTS